MCCALVGAKEYLVEEDCKTKQKAFELRLLTSAVRKSGAIHVTLPSRVGGVFCGPKVDEQPKQTQLTYKPAHFLKKLISNLSEWPLLMLSRVSSTSGACLRDIESSSSSHS